MSTQTNSIKRKLTLNQNGKKKRYFLEKKKWLSFGNRTNHFRYFDEDGYEIFDPLLIDILFDHWLDIYDVTNEYLVECDLDITEYNLFDDEEVTTEVKSIENVTESETFESVNREYIFDKMNSVNHPDEIEVENIPVKEHVLDSKPKYVAPEEDTSQSWGNDVGYESDSSDD
ncbi:MAG: hypothetical protein ACC656_00245 [Candidatus Heimdallarchaeota archaeon]